MHGDFPKQVFDLLQQQLAQTGRIGATRWVVSQTVGSVAAGDDSVPVPIQWPESGYVLALYGQVASGAAADYAGTSVRVQVGGTEDLIIDGRGAPAFLPFLGAFGGVSNWQPLMRRVSYGVQWLLTFRNETAGGVIPRVLFSFVSDRDVQKMAAGQR